MVISMFFSGKITSDSIYQQPVIELAGPYYSEIFLIPSNPTRTVSSLRSIELTNTLNPASGSGFLF
jgi:hypothetical protein